MKGAICKGLLFGIATICITSCRFSKDKYAEWGAYGGSKENIRYSGLTSIDSSNVSSLQVAWEYHTGDADSMTQIQVNPLIIGGILYGVSPKLKLFALDAATGQPHWVFDPALATQSGAKGNGYFSMNVCRGVAFYSDGQSDNRIFYAAGSFLFGVNANTGKLLPDFGDHGKLDLHDGLGRDVKDLYVSSTSPGIVYHDLLIVGTRVAEDAAAAPGYIRAYDVHTGSIRWVFHTIPQPGEPGYDSWDDKEAYKHIGGVNVWSGFSLDEARGILFAPTGSASYDFYGGKRQGNDLFANCLLALDAATGKLIWHFQTVHHDVWDRDLPNPPSLVTIIKEGKKIDAVSQTTKSGFIFLFDRENGSPIYPIEERPVPVQSELDSEKLSPTQPWPSLPAPFVRQSLTESDLNRLVPDSSYQKIRSRLASYKTGFIFNPPSKEGTVIFPGFDGGAEWGGSAYDPETGILYVNGSEMPWILTMVDVKEKAGPAETNLDAGKRLYASTCMACHGPTLAGAGNYPSLIGVGKKYNEDQFYQLLANGRRMMPALNQLSATEKTAIASFILNNKEKQKQKFVADGKKEDPYFKMPYTSTGYNKFLTPEGYPAVSPPWGVLNAINLNTGEYLWKDTLGDYPDLKARGVHSGTENYGGPVVTAGGVLFIAATADSKMRAFSKRTGKMLWETELPACGFATPSVYSVKGRQYVVIACGGGKLKKKSGDSYIAFALPDKP